MFLLLLLNKKLQAAIFVMCFVEGSPAWKPSGCALAPIMDLFCHQCSFPLHMEGYVPYQEWQKTKLVVGGRFYPVFSGETNDGLIHTH